ncbi:MAG: hypothetical protein IJV62_03840 [Eggerthellaceae bacterium]|nr:hypothetical protein [Eggerthellaceae bacterium]
MSNLERSESYGELQHIVDVLYKDKEVVRRVDAVLLAEMFDIHPDLQEIISLLPSGNYTRIEMCQQLNSAIAGHAWGYVYGTVE